MNEEIKKQIEDKLVDKMRELFYKDLEPMELSYIAGIMEVIEDVYLLGAKDMREAVKVEDMEIADFDGTNSTDISMRVGYNMAIKHTKRKAQQFIDSLSNS